MPAAPLLRRRLLAATGIAFAIAVAAVAVYVAFNDPAGDAPALQCPFKQLTGYDCPGCGAQRAFHAMVRGDIAAAWHFNPALFFLIPLALAYTASRGRLRRLLHTPAALIALAAGIIVWTVARNL